MGTEQLHLRCSGNCDDIELARRGDCNDDMGTDVRKSGSSDRGVDTVAATFGTATGVIACLTVIALGALTLGPANILHGEANVDFMEGQISVTTAATFCR